MRRTACVMAVLALLSAPAAMAASEVTVVFGVAVVDDRFDPEGLELTPTDAVEWTNQGARTHTVTADDGSFDSGPLEPGDRFRFEPTSTGTIEYHCSIHGGPGGAGMSGVLFVATTFTTAQEGTDPFDPPNGPTDPTDPDAPPAIPATGSNVPAGALVLFASSLIVLGFYLTRVERIVYPERF